MRKAKVMQLFQMFTRLPDVMPWEYLADAAMCTVRRQLREDADADDERLCRYAAALANLQYRRLIAAETVSPTYAGTVAGQRSDVQQCTLAEQLMLQYRADAADLLRDEAFVFAAV